MASSNNHDATTTTSSPSFFPAPRLVFNSTATSKVGDSVTISPSSAFSSKNSISQNFNFNDRVQPRVKRLGTQSSSKSTYPQINPLLPPAGELKFKFSNSDDMPMFGSTSTDDKFSKSFPAASTISINLPEEALNKLKCTACDNHLSIFPVHLHQNGSLVCGRCPVDSPDVIQNTAYEAVAAFIRFPCKNKKSGCKVTATPENMLTHEKTCKYESYNCFEKCEWNGVLQNVKDHYKESHERKLVKVDEDFDVATFLLKLKQENIKFFADAYLIHGIYSHLNYKFVLNFQLISNITVRLQEKEVRSIKDITDSNMETVIMDGIDLNKVNLCRININRKVEINMGLSKKFVADLSLSEQFLCSVCKKYMTSAIFECKNGHILCGSHMAFTMSCRICKEDGQLQRSLVLERIAANIKYRCINEGCNETYSKNENHNEICKFQTFRCPYVGCNGSGNFDLILAHVKEAHKQQDDLPLKLAKRNSTYVTIQNDTIFLQTLTFSDDSLKISVDVYAPKHEDINYMFELFMENRDERVFYKTSHSVFLPTAMITKSGTCDYSDWRFRINVIENSK